MDGSVSTRRRLHRFSFTRLNSIGWNRVKPVLKNRWYLTGGRRNTIRSAHIKFHTFIEARGASRRGDDTRVVVGYRAGRKNGKMKAVEPGETS